MRHATIESDTPGAEFVLANARLVLPAEVVHGSVVVRGGAIAATDTGAAGPADAIDCGGDYLAPGLVELHTDNLERHMSPRPKVDWPHRAAILAHDAELAGTGVTTVFDALRVGSITSGTKGDMARYARGLASEILSIRDTGLLKISHHLHLRAEICSETLADELAEFGPEDRIGIVSLMDHTPGQRQFTDITKLAHYMIDKGGVSEAEFESHMDFLRDLQNRVGARHETAAVAAARRLGAALVSHDDTTAAQVAASHSHGVAAAEFPTSEEAARASAAAGIAVIMGAPNLVRGGSHSGNVSARHLAEAGLLDILSSDYVPSSLLMGAMILADLWGDMAAGMATVTAHPADAAGLSDRGRLEPGRRADLIRFAPTDGIAALRGVWCQGRRVG